jgi:hypothetical protein
MALAPEVDFTAGEGPHPSMTNPTPHGCVTLSGC